MSSATAAAGATDYEKFDYQWSHTDTYEVVRKLHSGKNSDVFEGVNRATGEKCVIRKLKDAPAKRVKRHLLVLRALQGQCNTARLVECVLGADGSRSLVFQHIEPRDTRNLSLPQLRVYLYQLLRALQHAHTLGIMHRDVRRKHVLMDARTGAVTLVGWDLAEFYQSNTAYNIRTRAQYKAPEMLLNMPMYGLAVDMWAVGCLFLELLCAGRSGRCLKGRDTFDTLVRMARLLGTDDLRAYAAKQGLQLDETLQQLISPCPAIRQSLAAYVVTPSNQHMMGGEALDLLGRLLCYDHTTRLTCAQALAHPFFRDTAAPASASAPAPAAAPASAPASASAPHTAALGSEHTLERQGSGFVSVFEPTIAAAASMCSAYEEKGAGLDVTLPSDFLRSVVLTHAASAHVGQQALQQPQVQLGVVLPGMQESVQAAEEAARAAAAASVPVGAQRSLFRQAAVFEVTDTLNLELQRFLPEALSSIVCSYVHVDSFVEPAMQQRIDFAARMAAAHDSEGAFASLSLDTLRMRNPVDLTLVSHTPPHTATMLQPD